MVMNIELGVFCKREKKDILDQLCEDFERTINQLTL